MAKPKLALIPAAQGTKLYSVLPSDGSGDFDFTRGSTTNPDATRINAQGLIETVPNTSSRLNYPLLDGKVVGCPHHILESQRTNLITYSENFSNAFWTKSNSSIVSNNAISPDGTLNASKLVENTSNTEHICFNQQTGVSKTFSFFAKSAGNQYVAISYDGGTSFNFFDIVNGVLGNLADSSRTSKIEDYGNGWFRCSLFNGHSNFGATIWMSKDGTNTSYQGDGSSGVYIYGAQLEAGSFPTSYIKSNSGSATTRLAETATGSGSAATFNDSEGILMAEISALADDLTNRGITISDGSVNNRVTMFYTNVSNAIQVKVVVGGSNSLNSFITIPNISLYNKFALKYKTNSFSLFVNGFELITDTSGNTFSNGTLTELAFDRGDGAEDFYGNVKQVQYFDTTDIDLEELTSWDSFSDMANGQLYTIE